MFVTLRFTEMSSQTASVGSYSYIYAANDVYDPNVTGVGSQPLSYDQWTAIYNRWVVLASEIDVCITSRTVSGQLSCAVVPVTQSSVAPSSYEAAAQMRKAITASTTGGGPSPHLRSKIRMSDLYGVPLVTIQGDDAFAGATTASPNRRMCWALLFETSGASDSFSYTVTIKYKIRFFQPILSSVSLSAPFPRRSVANTERAVEAEPHKTLQSAASPCPGRVSGVGALPRDSQCSPPSSDNYGLS